MPLPTGNDQTKLNPQTTLVEGKPSFARHKAIECKAGQSVTINFTLEDTNGNPIDFSDISNPIVKARIKEVLSKPTDSGVIEINCNIVDPTIGRVDIPIPIEAVEYPGISSVDVALMDNTDKIYCINCIDLIVNRSAWSKADDPPGPPTIAEIRLFLRDSDPNDNLWRAVTEFDLAEIAAAIEIPVAYWNESPPPIPVKYNTSNFPFRYHWLLGIIAQLYFIAANWYRRVHLPYSAGGISVDDKNKANEYEQIGNKNWEEFKKWCTMTKVRMNTEQGYSSLLSTYSTINWWPV